jgi:hypothetical protein
MNDIFIIDHPSGAQTTLHADWWTKDEDGSLTFYEQFTDAAKPNITGRAVAEFKATSWCSIVRKSALAKPTDHP